jgi:hypothetical protein
MKVLNLLGKRFGRLTVLEPAGLNNYKIPHRMWKCRCDCGTEVIKSEPRLYSGCTKSCGCLNREHMRNGISRETRLKLLIKARAAWLRPGGAFRDLLASYKRNAKKRNLPWLLTDDQFRELTSSACYYTGKLPSSVWPAALEQYIYNGVDRVDSTRGYEPENCVPCCAEINWMKRDLDPARFMELCTLVAEHHHRKTVAA